MENVGIKKHPAGERYYRGRFHTLKIKISFGGKGNLQVSSVKTVNFRQLWFLRLLVCKFFVVVCFCLCSGVDDVCVDLFYRQQNKTIDIELGG